MNEIAELLKTYGPMLSGDLARLYERIYGVSNEAARKAFSRANAPVKNSIKLNLIKINYFTI